MNNLKKTVLAAVMTLVSIPAFAQFIDDNDRGFSDSEFKTFRMGIQANFGISNTVYDGNIGFGYGAGWIAEYNFTPKFYLQSGIGFQNVAHTEEYIDGTINAFYAQIPIYAGYRFELNETTSFFLQAGPTLSIGMWATEIMDDWGSESYFDTANRFDLKLGGRAGVEINRFQISIGGDYGVLDPDYSTYCANIGIAYMF